MCIIFLQMCHSLGQKEFQISTDIEICAVGKFTKLTKMLSAQYELQ